ncbi:MAG: MFS transporter [Gammaproteobacteria bacterium]|nr:MFS transporter [Gammaproteobacteria bacterium]
MTAVERRAVSTLAAVFALRMFGLFVVLPVLVLYAGELRGATALTAGLALGVYGLTQALLQIPFGVLSDRFPRKTVIHAGLICFIAGSIVAALADSIAVMIAGRALQGGGAIASAVLALTADLTRDRQRAKAMAVIGVSIGGVFMLSLVLGPALDGWVGVRGMFWLAAALGVAAMVLLQCVAEPLRDAGAAPNVTSAGLRKSLTDAALLRLNFGIFTSHLALTALFVVLPGALLENLSLPPAQHWKVYIPVLAASLPVMALLVRHTAQPGGQRRAVLFSALLLVLSQGALYAGLQTGWILVFGAWLFFCGFNTLEAALPAEVSRRAGAADKGAALGVYYSAQFLGVFCGGLAGGWLAGSFSAAPVFLFCAAPVAVFGILSARAAAETAHRTLVLAVDAADSRATARRLAALSGVVEVTLLEKEKQAWLRVDPERFDVAQLRGLAYFHEKSL